MTDPGDWRLRARCRVRGDCQWWDETLDGQKESKDERARRHEKAKAVCMDCPVALQCHEATVREDCGIRFGVDLHDWKSWSKAKRAVWLDQFRDREKECS